MKIVLVTHFFPPAHYGGTEAYTLGLARGLARMGHSPHVICAEDWGAGDSWLPAYEDTTYQGIPVRRLRWNWRLAPDPFVNFYRNPETERHITHYLQSVQPDVVHVTSCYTLGSGAITAPHRLGLPTIITLTDFWFLCHRHTLLRGDGSLCGGPESAFKCFNCTISDTRSYQTLRRVLTPDLAARGLLALSRWPKPSRPRGLAGRVGDNALRFSFLRDAFLDSVDVALAPSQFLIDMFVRNAYPADRFRLSRYGLDQSWVSDLRPRDSGAKLKLGYIGQIDPIKGVDLLVRAFSSIKDAPAELRIYGDLSKNPAFAKALRSLAAGCPEIHFMGPFERAQISGVLSGLDAVIVPSVWYENTPLAILESLAAGKPVIATNLSGMSELVQHGVNGLLFERGDADALASAIRLVVSDSALRRRLEQGVKPPRSIEQETEYLVRLYDTTVARVAVGAGSRPR